MGKRRIALLLGVLLALTLTACDSSDYKKAASLYEAGSYAEALALYESLGDYEDSADRANDCRLELARAQIDAGDPAGALPALRELGDYGDAAALRSAAAQAAARDYIKANGKALDALGAFNELADYDAALKRTDGSDTVFAAVNDEDQVVLGRCYNGSRDEKIHLWCYTFTLSEDGTDAVREYSEVEIGTVGGLKFNSVQYGKDSIEPADYDGVTLRDMSLGNRTTLGESKSDKDILLSKLTNEEETTKLLATPSEAVSLVESAGVTLADLGFTALEADAPAQESQTTEQTQAAQEAQQTQPAEESQEAEETQETRAVEESQAPQESAAATAGERRALEMAKTYLESTAFSQKGLADQLEYEGFTPDEAAYGAEHCGADWTAQADQMAKTYLESTAFSYNGLVEQLEYEGFSHDLAVHGADRCGADWNRQAVLMAETYLENSAFSRQGLVEQLEYEGFTHDQAVYGVEQSYD